MHPRFKRFLFAMLVGVPSLQASSGRLLDPFRNQGVGGVEVVSFRTGERTSTDDSGRWTLSPVTTRVDSRDEMRSTRSRGLELHLGRRFLPNFQAIAVSGRRFASRNGIPRAESILEVEGSPRASLSLLDTLFFFQNGRLVLKDTLSDPLRTGIEWDLDTGWNAAILYGQILDVRDGRRYRTVAIGSQTWLAQNLAFNAPGSGVDSTVPDSTSLFGRTYRWHVFLALPDSCSMKACSTLVQSPHRGVCPVGFHVPSYREWVELLSAAGGQDSAGTHLKSKNFWRACPSDNRVLPTTDRFGFRAWPRYYGSSGGNAAFLAADEYSHEFATDVVFSQCMESWMSSMMIPGLSNKSTRYSARCVADAP